MKIKHWQGYGKLDAKVLKRETISVVDNKKRIVIEISGNHEYGCVRDDKYDIKNWLLDRFDKNNNASSYDINYEIENGYRRNDEKGVTEEYAIYRIEY